MQSHTYTSTANILCNLNSRISEEAYVVEIDGYDKLVQRSDPRKERGPDRPPSPKKPQIGADFFRAIPLDVRKGEKQRERIMVDRVSLSKFVCRQNIGRYERLLRTELTDLERAFIKRRLAEEKQALQFTEAQTSSRAGGKGTIAALLLNPLEFLVPNFSLVEQIALI